MGYRLGVDTKDGQHLYYGTKFFGYLDDAQYELSDSLKYLMSTESFKKWDEDGDTTLDDMATYFYSDAPIDIEVTGTELHNFLYFYSIDLYRMHINPVFTHPDTFWKCEGLRDCLMYLKQHMDEAYILNWG